MTSLWRFGLIVGATLALAAAGGTGAARAQPAADPTAAEAREKQAAERFLALLERQPRFGTALDKVYAYQIERGTLDAFVASQTQRSRDADGGAAAMIVGLVEFQRGRDGAAVAAFQQADKLRPDDPLAAYYLGRALILVGRPEEAAQAYERALERKPARNDLLEISQALGQLYQRARQPERALAVWDRLEQAFPDDLRVQEQIAGVLADEGDHAGALARFEKLAAKATDPYRQVQYRLRVGELKLRLGRADEAVAGWEALLSRLKPDSWLHRDVRQRIEATFLRTDDYDGLTKYYEKWLEKQPDDLDAMGRLAHVLGLQNRVPEAEARYRQALKMAPSNKSLRRALIALLTQAKRPQDAAAEYAELDKLEPNNPDTLRAWGQLVLTDSTLSEDERRQRAASIWRKLLVNKPKDPVVASQVADLFRQAQLTDDALDLYRKAIELAPKEPQYREYLGEYLHTLDRRDEALAVWQEIATGDQRNTKTLLRLAEVYRGFGYREQSLEAMGQACALDPEFADIVRYATMLREAAQHDPALQQLDRADQLAANDDERDQVLAERIKVYVDAGRVDGQIAALERAVEASPTSTQWRTLALLYEAARRPGDAGRAVAKALELDDKSASVWATAARLYENSGQLAQAVAANQQLAALDRRARSDYLQRIANLYVRLGRANDALQAGQDVIAAAPGNPEHYQFYAGLCFQFGKIDDGLNALRRAVRVNPADGKALQTLASALAQQFRTDEAIEIYWRAFDVADDVEGRNSIVASLAELYLRTNHYDRLVARLERLGKEQRAERESAYWLAAAHQAAGDVGAARETLAQLLTEDSKDTQLLAQLSKLAEAEYDLDQALAYQRRIAEIAPSRDVQQQIAGLLLRSGDASAAEDIWFELARTDTQPHRLYDAIDDMLRTSRHDAALNLCERLLRDNPQDWEALYRAGLALWKLGKHDDALARLDQLAALPLPDDRPSAKAAFQKAQAAARPTPAPTSVRGGMPANYPAALLRSQLGSQIQESFTGDESRYYGGQRPLWMPTNVGDARLAAPLARYARAAQQGKMADIYADLQRRATLPETSAAELWNLLPLAGAVQRYQQVQSEAAKVESLLQPLARRLARLDDPSGKLVFLALLRESGRAPRPRGAAASAQEPLPQEDLDLALECYRALRASQPDWLDSFGLTQQLALELKAAQREADAEQLYGELRARHDDFRAALGALRLASALGKTDDLIELAGRVQELAATQPSAGAPYSTGFVWSEVSQTFIEKQDWPNVRAALERLLTARAQELKSPARSQRAAGQVSSGPLYISVLSSGGRYRTVQLDYPPPSARFDHQLLSALYGIFAAHQEPQQFAELLQFTTTRAAAADPETQLLFRLVASYFLWWNKQPDEAVAALQAAAARAPQDAALRLQLGGMLLKRGRAAEALAVADDIEPLDHQALRDRELLALQAAVTVGDVERARKSAERLFGLQLDAGLQFRLAQLMHQLGMHELAENVLDRIRKRSGNQTGVLAQLMQQYLAQGNNDAAGQIAQQLLRRSRPNSGQRGYRTSEDVHREQALQVLNRTGHLAKIIARVEGQLQKSPNSLLLLESLADYYKAAGQNDKAQEMLNRLAQQQPQDGRALFQLAEQLSRGGNVSGACDAYLQAIKKDPARLEDRYWELRNTFQRAKRIPDLAAALQDIDLRPLRSFSYRIAEIVGELVRAPETRDAGLKLLRRAWNELPDQRLQMLSHISDARLWDTEEVYNFAREAVIPRDAPPRDVWQGVADSITWHGDGRVTGLLSRLLQSTHKPERRHQLQQEVAAAAAKHPGWLGGQAILVALEARSGATAAAEQRVAALLEKKADMPGRVALILGQELNEAKVLQPQAIQLLEWSLSDNDSVMDQFDYHPGRYLARMYHEAGDRRHARQLIYDVLAKLDFSRYSVSNPGYAEHQDLRSLQTAAQDFLKMGLPLDAVRLYNQATADPNKLAAARWGGSSMHSELTRGLDEARKALSPKALTDALDDWVRAPADPPTKPNADKPAAVVPLVDFALAVQPRIADKVEVQSLLEIAVRSAAGKPVLALASPPPQERSALQLAASVAQQALAKLQSGPGAGATARQAGVLDKLRAQLAAAMQQSDDLSLRAAAALLELVDDEAPLAAKTAALQTLATRLQTAPAEPQKAAAPGADQLALWVVARLALRHPTPEVRTFGADLARRALQAAQRHPDRMWLLAMLREQGQLAADAGDKAAAERFWGEMLDEILTPARTAPAARKTSATRPRAPQFTLVGQ